MKRGLSWWLDVTRRWTWTGYGVGADHAGGTDTPYPTAGHVSHYSTYGGPTVGDADREREDNSPNEVGRATTQFEALQLEAGELAASRIVEGWAAVRYKLAIPARLNAVDARRAWNDVKRHDERHQKKEHAQSAEWSLWLKVPLLLTFALPEYPLTRAAFEIFRLSSNETGVVAFGCAIGLIFLADTVGRAIRQKGWNIVHTLAVAMLLSSVIALAALRADVLRQVEAAQRSRLQAEIASLATAAAAAKTAMPDVSALSMTPGTGLWSQVSLGTLAALFVIAGMVVGYRAHDVDPELWRIVTGKNRAWARLRKSLRHVIVSAAAYDGRREVAAQQLNAVRERTLMTIREYRYSNERWRGQPADLPASFQDDINERFFKTRSLGPAMLPIADELETAVTGAESDPFHAALDRLMVVASPEAAHG